MSDRPGTRSGDRQDFSSSGRPRTARLGTASNRPSTSAGGQRPGTANPSQQVPQEEYIEEEYDDDDYESDDDGDVFAFVPRE